MKPFLVLVNMLTLILATVICFGNVGDYNFLKISIFVLSAVSLIMSLLVQFLGTPNRGDKGKNGYTPPPFTPTSS